MEKIILFKHRHKRFNESLANCFFEEKMLSKNDIEQLKLIEKDDFKQENIDIMKLGVASMPLIEDKKDSHKVNRIEAFVIEEGKIISYLDVMIDSKKKGYIMLMETLPEYRNRGIASNLLEDMEELLFKSIEIKDLISYATDFSKGLFEKEGYMVEELESSKLIKEKYLTTARIFKTRQMYLSKEKEND